MNKFKRIIFIVTLTLILTGCQLNKNVNNNTNQSNGDKQDYIFDQLRIENEDKIVVPYDKVNEISDYLITRYIKTDKFLKEINSNLIASSSTEEFTDIYYDTPDLAILANSGGVRYRQRLNLTDPNDKKSGKELMQIKINNVSSDKLSRGELKFDIEHLTNKISSDDKHQMIGLVKNSQREDFKTVLKDLGFEPYSMKPIINIKDYRQRIYFSYNNEDFVGISLDQVTAERDGRVGYFAEIEPELNEVAFTEGDDAKRQLMKEIQDRMVGDLMTKFPYLYQDLAPKYTKGYNVTK